MSGRFGSDDRETVSAQPNKRRRVALACSNCRHRKSRCDGRRPKCSLCCELGCECLYEHAGTTTSLTVGRSYLDRLENRLKDIETSLKTVQDNQASSIHESTSEQRRSGTRCDTRNSEDSVGSARVDGSLLYQNNGGFGEIDNAEDSVDGMGAIKFTDEEDWGYFGPSSNISFLRHISLAMARAGDLTQAFPSPVSHAREISGGISVSRPHHVESDRNTRTFHGSVNIYALPSESRTWALIKEYFQKTGQLLPFVHEESFCTAYFEMKKKNFTMVRRTWLGLLNIILACATTLHVDSETTTEKRIEESDLYYQRANGLCDKESRRTISVELVQYLLILGQYLQSTQKSVLAWTVHGLAITTAFQLGLPSPKTNKGFPPLECEIRKRVWFGCVLLDRTLSMTFGRPSMIPEKYLKLDMPLSNLQMVGQPLMPVLAPQMDAMFFTATIKLYNVMHQVIDTCYGQNLGLEEYHTEAEIIPLVLKGEEQLDEWKSQLTPLQMRVYDAPISSKDLEKMYLENKITERFLMVLSVRYHNLQILLHRPILEKFLETCVRKSSGERGMVQQLGINGIETCVNSAVISISIVHTVVCSEGWRRDLLGAWNYSLFYTFNAGLVIFAAMHIARNNVRSDVKRASHWDFMEQALPYFQMAIEALENLDRGNRVIERCVSYLSQLSTTSLGSESLGSSLNGGQPNGNANVHQSEDGLSPLMNRSQYHSHQQDHTGRMASSARMGNPGIAPRQVPVEIDLNEFMLDTDLDFFGRQFNVGTYDQAFQ